MKKCIASLENIGFYEALSELTSRIQVTVKSKEPEPTHGS